MFFYAYCKHIFFIVIFCSYLEMLPQCGWCHNTQQQSDNKKWSHNIVSKEILVYHSYWNIPQLSNGQDTPPSYSSCLAWSNLLYKLLVIHAPKWSNAFLKNDIISIANNTGSHCCVIATGWDNKVTTTEVTWWEWSPNCCDQTSSHSPESSHPVAIMAWLPINQQFKDHSCSVQVSFTSRLCGKWWVTLHTLK